MVTLLALTRNGPSTTASEFRVPFPITEALGPRMVKALLTSMFSVYVPAATSITSPAVAALMAA